MDRVGRALLSYDVMVAVSLAGRRCVGRHRHGAADGAGLDPRRGALMLAVLALIAGTVAAVGLIAAW
jgi:hypothetical protein